MPSSRRARSSWGATCSAPAAGEWDESWTGWWGDDPPYHATRLRARPPPARARGDAGRDDVSTSSPTGSSRRWHRPARRPAPPTCSIAGGAATVNQYLAAGAIDELRLHVVPIVLGVGERLFDGVGALSLERVGVDATDLVTHVTYRLVGPRTLR